jgi:hypothetical protein
LARIKLSVILFFIGFLTVGANGALGYPPFLKQAQQSGFDAKDCTYCHEKPSGGRPWNKRGLWLKEQKKERKAPVVDVRWLKDYNPDDGQTAKDDQNLKKEPAPKDEAPKDEAPKN